MTASDFGLFLATAAFNPCAKQNQAYQSDYSTPSLEAVRPERFELPSLWFERRCGEIQTACSLVLTTSETLPPPRTMVPNET